MGHLRLFFLGMILLIATQSLGIAPPPGLCRIVSAMNGAADGARLTSYFAPSQGYAYESLTPELRQKLIEASVAMISLPSETEGRRTFAGENWGTTGIAHLWLLGLSEAEIRVLVDPLLQEYFETRVAPGLGVLSLGRDFRSPTKANLPDVSGEPGNGPRITRIKNGNFVSGNRELAEALQRARDVASIDSDFSETNAGILKFHFDGAMLSGNRQIAREILDYMKLVGPEVNETIYAIEMLGTQSEMLAHGTSLLQSSLHILSTEGLAISFRSQLEAAIESFSRVKDPALRQGAHQALLQIARLLESSEFRNRFPKNDLEDHHTEYYDLALLALQGLGEIVGRHYVDSVQVRLTFRFSPKVGSEVSELIGKITDHYMTFGKRAYYTQFDQVRRALLAAEDKARLRRYGELLLSRASEWAQDWWPTHPYWSAYEFFYAAGDRVGCRKALVSLFDNFPLVEEFSQDQRGTIDQGTFSGWVDRLGELRDAAGLRILLEVAEKNNWTKEVEKIAVTQAGEDKERSLYPHLPEIPAGIGPALEEDIRTRQGSPGTQPSPEEKARLVANGERKWRAGNVDMAWEAFRKARSSYGMTLLGDAYLKAHREARHSRGAHFGATAHGAYFLAAIFAAEERTLSTPK